MRKQITDWNKFREQFVRWTLRRASFRWPPRGDALRAARVDRGLYECAICKGRFKTKEVKLDHIEPVVPVPNADVRGVQEAVRSPATSLDLGSFVHRMFPEASGFQVLCGGCHDRKTASETAARAEARRAAKARRKGHERLGDGGTSGQQG